MNIVTGQKVVNFCSLYLPGISFQAKKAMGFEIDGYMVLGVVFDNFRLDAKGRPLEMEGSVVALDKRAVTRYNLRNLFSFAFSEPRIRRLTIRAGRREYEKRNLIKRLGFKEEGIAREAWPYGGDAAVYSMLYKECPWIDHGKLSLPASSARPDCHSAGANSLKSANGALSSRA